MATYRTDKNQNFDRNGNVVAEQVVQVDVTEEVNQSSIETNLNQDLIALQAIIDTPNATINSNPAAHIKTMARNAKRLTRTALKDYSSAD